MKFIDNKKSRIFGLGITIAHHFTTNGYINIYYTKGKIKIKQL